MYAAFVEESLIVTMLCFNTESQQWMPKALPVFMHTTVFLIITILNNNCFVTLISVKCCCLFENHCESYR